MAPQRAAGRISRRPRPAGPRPRTGPDQLAPVHVHAVVLEGESSQPSAFPSAAGGPPCPDRNPGLCRGHAGDRAALGAGGGGSVRGLPPGGCRTVRAHADGGQGVAGGRTSGPRGERARNPGMARAAHAPRPRAAGDVAAALTRS